GRARLECHQDSIRGLLPRRLRVSCGMGIMRHIFVVLIIVLLHVQSWSAPKAGPEPTPQPAQDDFGDIPPPPSGIAPLRPVFDYLRFYESQPARVLPYITEHFRGGMEPRLWVDQTRALLAAQGYTRLAWTVHHLEMTDTGGEVHVTTRARIDGQELLQKEIFVLVRTPEGEWLIDDWHLE